MTESVFLALGNYKIEWKNHTLISIPKPQDISTSLEIGVISDTYTMKLELRTVKALFFDLGETLVTFDEAKKKFVNFPQTYEILTDLERRKIGIGIISDGNRSDLNLLEDQNLLSRFRIIVMSEDEDVQAPKPNPKIFNKAISKMRSEIGIELKASGTAFISENVNHFRIYNFEFSR